MSEHVVTQMHWHLADNERPPVSGTYFIYNAYSSHGSTMEYSKKHDAFNVSDSMSDEDAYRYSIKVDYWSFIPDELLKQRRD